LSLTNIEQREMRRILLAVVLLVCVASLRAQSVIGGNLEAIKDVQQIQVSFDYQDALIQGMIFEDFMAKEQREFSNSDYYDFEEEWTKSLAAEHITRFVTAYNKVATKKKLPVLVSKDVPTKLVVKFAVLERNGEAQADYQFMDSEGHKVAVVRWASPKGGVFGTFLNLLGDASEENGENFAKFLNKNINKSLFSF
jgi:hypothetical protein